MEEYEVELKNIVDDMKDDLDVCMECGGTWKVACYGAWTPNSQFWDDFLEDGWEDGAYSPRACCLRFMCGVLFCFFAPIWCCKAILFFIFWPCICCVRALREGNCNKDYCSRRRSRPTAKFDKSQPLTYIESARPAHPTEISYQFSAPRGIPPESPIPEIRIETELDNGTYVTSPVEDSEIDRELSTKNSQRLPPGTRNGRQLSATVTNDRQVPLAATATTRPLPVGTSHHQVPNSTTSNGHQMTTSHANNGRIHTTRPQYQDDNDLPPPYPMSQSPRAKFPRNRSSTQPSSTQHTHSSSTQHSAHSTAKKTMSAKAKGMDNNLYRAVVMEGFQGITGKVTTV